MEVSIYRDRIKLLAQSRGGTPIYSGSQEHAAIILEHLFFVAQADVRILSGDLNARVYGAPGVVQRAREFLSHSKRRLRILLEHQTFIPTHPLICGLAGDRNVRVALMPESVSSDVPYHFATADNDCFRFEPQKDIGKAVAIFGDATGATNLNHIFDDIWMVSEEQELPVFAH
jgi:hypothetical protein